MTLAEQALAAFRSGDTEKTRELAEEMRRSGEEVTGLCYLARLAGREGDAVAARKFADEARALAPDENAARMPLHLQAFAARLGGQIDQARQLYLESIELNRRLESPFASGELYNLGFLELRAGNLDRARELFSEALAEGKARGFDALPPLVILGQGALAVEEGDAKRGVRLLAAGQNAFEQKGEVLDPDDQVEVDLALEKARAALSPEEFAEADAEGRALSVDEALS
jgi:tetratricopeptide (TPR) repeat protein